MKAVALRIGLVLFAWLLGSVLAMFLMIFVGRQALDTNHRLYDNANSAYILFFSWAMYRMEAYLARLPLPRGKMRTVINLTWAILAYTVVGGSVELVVGGPTLAAGLSGIPFAVVLYLLLARQQSPVPSQ
jgi:hypothetical protein